MLRPDQHQYDVSFSGLKTAVRLALADHAPADLARGFQDALIETLDTQHVVTRNRPGLPGKLSRQTWRDLNYRVFRVYLPFVTDRRKYLGLPR